MNTARLVDAVVAFALVVVVPSTTSLLGVGRAAIARMRVAGVVGSASFLVGEGLVAAGLVIPWVAAGAWLAWRETQAFRSQGREAAPRALAVLYLLGGAFWLVASRYGARPLGFGDDIVELTAVHFHYAGFVASILMLQLEKALRRVSPRSSRLGHACLFAVLAATPITAGGITFNRALGALGALLFFVSLAVSAVLLLTRVVPGLAGAPAVLLATSALSILPTMVLAVAYALGEWLQTPAPSVSVMAWTHGIANAVAFSLCGALGWTLASRTRAGGRDV